ncbi:MAG: c-type cytochrome [Gallionella sp.]
MSLTRINITSGLVIMLLYAMTAFAGDSPQDIKKRIGPGDPVAGKEKSALCQGCHGESGISATPDFPKLAGQYAAYIQKQIHDFQSGSRKDPVMSGMAATVTDNQDLLDISAYFASQKQMKGDSPVISKGGKERFLSDNGCVNCHGPNGKGAGPGNPHAPVIGGQHKDYLVKQLKDFRSGARTNEPSGMMALISGMMSDEEMEEIASYVSGM